MDRDPNLAEMLQALWRLARPEVWMVTFLPVLIGHVLATRELLPGLDTAIAFWHQATSTGATSSEFLATLSSIWDQAHRLLLGLLVMGPLLWTATLLINDVHDLDGDRLNPRKARSPLVQGVVSRGWASNAAHGIGAAALIAAWFVGTTFFLLVLANLVLAWAYSVPPVRLKTRPGADVAVNAIGVGLLSGLAGWSLAAPLIEFPFHLAPQALAVAIAVYVPTTLVDREADLESGYLTLATHLGKRRAYHVGWVAWIACNIGALLLSWTNTVIPRAMFPLLVVFVPLLLYQYHIFIGKAQTGPARVQGIILCSLTFLAVNCIFALMYTGLWNS